MRCLHVKNGLITNIVEYPGTPPFETDSGETVVPDLTSSWSVGDPYDVTGDLDDRKIDSVDAVVFGELFRLTNAVRALNSQAAITKAQYRSFIKSLL